MKPQSPKFKNLNKIYNGSFVMLFLQRKFFENYIYGITPFDDTYNSFQIFVKDS